jgi:leucyl-tRNA synthetase
MDGVAKDVRRATHKLIEKATGDIEQFAFNTYVAAMMEHLNTINDLIKKSGEGAAPSAPLRLALSEMIELTTLILAPGAPHSADEIWEGLGKQGFTFNATWPKADPAHLIADTVTIAVQVNGKLRDTLELPAQSTKEQLEAAAMASDKAKPHYDGKTVKKVIVVPGKLVNIVAS